MEFSANLMSPTLAPGPWAAEREAEGWDVVTVADHLWTSTRPYPHVWVTATALATATRTIRVGTAFANNLFRHPVEFVQASLALQSVSGGRFEAGLGAGWAQLEMEQTGRPFPPPGERAGRYLEALRIARELFDHGEVDFVGRWYEVHVPRIGPRPAVPPPLVGSLGGPRTIRGGVGLLDRVEVKVASAVTSGGGLDLAALGRLPVSHARRLIAEIRAERADVPLSVFALCRVGDDEATRAFAAGFERDSFYGPFMGPAAQVAEAMWGLAELGVDRVQVSPFNDDAYAHLAPHLFGTEVSRRRATPAASPA